MGKQPSHSTLEAVAYIREHPEQFRYKVFKQANPQSDVTNNQFARLRYEVLQRPDKDRRYAETAGVDLAQAAAQSRGHIPGQEEYLKRAEQGLVSREADQLTVKPPPTDEEYEEYFRLLEEADEIKGTLYSQQMETTFHPPEPNLPIGVCFTGDWHLGGGGVLYKRLREDLELIRDTPGLFVIGTGDYKDNFKPQNKSGSGLYGGVLNGPAWQNKMVLMRAKIAQGKWLAIGDGNHDAWDFSTAGLASTPELARALNAPFFGEGGGTVFVEMRGTRYAIGVRHNGPGNSRLNTTNAQRRAFDEWPQWENMDVICLAHFHFNDMQQVTRKAQPVVYFRNGTYKAGKTGEGVPRDEYSSKLGLSPEYGVPIVILYPDKKEMVPYRGDNFLHGIRFLQAERERYQAEAA